MKLSLQELLRLSRDNGALEMSAETEDAGVVTFKLAPASLTPEPVELPRPVNEPPLPKPERKVGKDGLTAEEQDALYMKPMGDTSIE